MKSKWKQVLDFYLTFLKIGCFTFGGGLNILAQIQSKYVESEKLMSVQELVDTFCVAKSLPGTMVTNVTYLFGYQIAGVPGGLSCVLGLVTAPTIILSIITLIYNSFKDNVYVMRFMFGVRAVVVSIILAAILKMFKSSFPNWMCIPVGIIAFVAFSFLGLNSLLIILFGALCGLLISSIVNSKKKSEKETSK